MYSFDDSLSSAKDDEDFLATWLELNGLHPRYTEFPNKGAGRGTQRSSDAEHQSSFNMISCIYDAFGDLQYTTQGVPRPGTQALESIQSHAHYCACIDAEAKQARGSVNVDRKVF